MFDTAKLTHQQTDKYEKLEIKFGELSSAWPDGTASTNNINAEECLSVCGEICGFVFVGHFRL